MNKTHEVVEMLKAVAEPGYTLKMEHFGVSSGKALGVRTPEIRGIARKLKKDHDLSLSLWDTGIHEARMLATMIGDPKLITREQMENWLSQAYSWDLCDGACFNLFHRTDEAWALPYEWVEAEHEFTKRAGFALMAKLALGNKDVKDQVYVDFLDIIPGYAQDERDMVKKAVSWAVRQIGKRRLSLNPYAIGTAEVLAASENKGARWAGKDALRELRSNAVQTRLRKKAGAPGFVA